MHRRCAKTCLIDTDIDTKVSRDTYRRYKYLDTAHLCLSPTKLLDDDRAVENAKEIAHTFNQYFVEVGHSIAQSTFFDGQQQIN